MAPPGQAAVDRAHRAALARTALAAPNVAAETVGGADQAALAKADQEALTGADQEALPQAAVAASTAAAPMAVVVPTTFGTPVPTASAPTLQNLPNQAHSASTYRLFLI